MNKYKIDVNEYACVGDQPYALYMKPCWWRKWRHVRSFKNITEATEFAKILIHLPRTIDG